MTARRRDRPGNLDAGWQSKVLGQLASSLRYITKTHQRLRRVYVLAAAQIGTYALIQQLTYSYNKCYVLRAVAERKKNRLHLGHLGSCARTT